MYPILWEFRLCCDGLSAIKTLCRTLWSRHCDTMAIMISLQILSVTMCYTASNYESDVMTYHDTPGIKNFNFKNWLNISTYVEKGEGNIRYGQDYQYQAVPMMEVLEGWEWRGLFSFTIMFCLLSVPDALFVFSFHDNDFVEV